MSSNESRELAVPKYFKKTPTKPDEPNYMTLLIGIAVIGISVVAMGSGSLMAACLGILGISGGIGVLIAGWGEISARGSSMKKYQEDYPQAEPKPSDKQMDDWLNGDVKRLKSESLYKLDLVAEQIMGDPNDPIFVIGPSAGASLAVGEDNVIRFSKYDLVIVYLTDYHLAAYKCTLDMAHGTTTSESTQEYHYMDVVSVATQTGGSGLFVVMVNGENKSVASFQKFALSVASGERIEIVVDFPQLSDIVEKGKLLPTGAENAIKVIRARLREKKGGTQV